MSTRFPTLGFIALCALLSGCVSGATKASDSGTTSSPDATIAGPAQVSDTQGGIEGVVVDDSIQPIANAQVGLQGTDQALTTGPTGAFTFSNLAPGKYVVLANALGHESGALTVEVQAGVVANARFVLPFLPTAVAYTETKVFSGLIECAWGLSGAGSGNCAPIQSTIQQYNLPNPTNTRIIGLFEIADPASAKGGVFELTWAASAATTAGQLLLAVELEGTGIINGKVYGQAQGNNPVKVTTADAPFKDLKPAENKNKVQTRTFPAGTTPPTLVVNQRFSVYATTCYVENCDPAFSALVDQ